MEKVLNTLEEKIEQLLTAYNAATARCRELETRVAALEEESATAAELGDRVQAFESQREELVGRLEKVLAAIDGALASHDG